MEIHPLIEKALMSTDVGNSLIELLDNPQTSIEAAVNLAEVADCRAVGPLLDKCQNDFHPAFVYALTSLDCAGHEMELIRVGLESGLDSQQHVLEILGNVREIEPQSARVIQAAINLKKELLSEGVVNIGAKKFLASVEKIIDSIPPKSNVVEIVPMVKTAKILNFPARKSST